MCTQKAQEQPREQRHGRIEQSLRDVEEDDDADRPEDGRQQGRDDLHGEPIRHRMHRPEDLTKNQLKLDLKCAFFNLKSRNGPKLDKNNGREREVFLKWLSL